MREEFLVDACGESIAQISLIRNLFEPKYLEQMKPAARHGAISVIAANKPEWLKNKI